MRIELSVDPELCIGSGDCVRLVPAAFALDEAAGVAVPRTNPGDTAPEDLEPLLRAAIGCPTQAIRVVVDGVVRHDSNG